MKKQLRVIAIILCLIIGFEATPIPTLAYEGNMQNEQSDILEELVTGTTETTSSEDLEPTSGGYDETNIATVELDKPLDEATVLGEVKDLRDERSKYFRLNDGSYSAVNYDTDVHFKNENQEWEQIDNSLVEDTDETDGTGYINKKGRVRFKFAKNTNQKYLVRMQQGSTHLYVSLQKPKGNQSAKVGKGKEKRGPKSAINDMEVENIRSSVVYEDILEDTDIEYIADGSSLKENIVVKSPQKQYQYTFDIKVNKLEIKQAETGELTFVSTENGKVMYSIPQLYMIDARGNQSDGVTCQTTIKKNDKSCTLVITADAEWINAEDRAFPVTIDPTLEATSSSTGADSRIVRNQYVSSGHPTKNYAGYGAGFLGYDSSGDYKYRTFVQFQKLPKLPADSVIAQSKFLYAQINYDHCEMSELIVAAKEVTTDWTWGTSINWNTQPEYSNTVLDYQVLSSNTTGQYIGWDITPLIKAHYEDKDNTTTETSSFALVTYDESVLKNTKCAKAKIVQENSAGYFSSAEPVLAIAYRSTRGLEDYYTYPSQSAGRAGTGHVGDYTSQLTVEKDILGNKGSVIPFTLSYVYNSSCANNNFTFSSGLINARAYSNMKIGLGWKLNIQESTVYKGLHRVGI